MSYITTAQLIERYGSQILVDLTDRAEVPTGAIVQSVIDRALADADARIDAYLAGRYTLPMAEVPAVLVGLAGAITIYLLHVHQPGEKIRADYDDALRELDRLAKGHSRLVGAVGIEPAPVSGSGVLVTDRDRPFTADNMKGFI